VVIAMFIKPKNARNFKKLIQKFNFVKVDRDEFIDLCEELSIVGHYPSFLAYENGGNGKVC